MAKARGWGSTRWLSPIWNGNGTKKSSAEWILSSYFADVGDPSKEFVCEEMQSWQLSLSLEHDGLWWWCLSDQCTLRLANPFFEDLFVLSYHDSTPRPIMDSFSCLNNLCGGVYSSVARKKSQVTAPMVSPCAVLCPLLPINTLIMNIEGGWRDRPERQWSCSISAVHTIH